MNTDKALEIIRALANGVDPYTGEEYPADSPYQSPQTVMALFMATQALERTKKADDKLRKLPDNAGKAWDDEEDRRLIKAFDSGQTTKQLAEEHQRTEGSIRSRLMKQGKM
jgi:DNA-binding NarL/FixJ family response regulator